MPTHFFCLSGNWTLISNVFISYIFPYVTKSPKVFPAKSMELQRFIMLSSHM